MKMKKIIFLTSLKSLKKGVGSGFISQRYGSGDPDPHQNVTDPQHWFLGLPDPHPDPLDKGTDPGIRIRIRIRTKMSRIHNTVFCNEEMTQ
jgi:hypothetical protein